MKHNTIEIKVAEYQFDELPEDYKNLIEEAKYQTRNAYAQYSHFHVGAAVLLDNGAIVTGNNQENAAYPSGTCAERVAMFYANSKFPESAPRMMAIAAYTNGKYLEEPISPCGSCRQALLESEKRYGNAIKIILYGTEKIYVLENIQQLLPLSFEKQSLKRK